jgi:hypothetical protein
MPRVGFEQRTLVFERAKTFRALDPAADVSESIRSTYFANFNILCWRPELEGENKDSGRTVLNGVLGQICFVRVVTGESQMT